MALMQEKRLRNMVIVLVNFLSIIKCCGREFWLLGSNDDRPLRRICSESYLKLMKTIVVSRTIAYFRDI